MEGDGQEQGPDVAVSETLDDIVDPVEHGHRMSELFPRLVTVYSHSMDVQMLLLFVMVPLRVCPKADVSLKVTKLVHRNLGSFFAKIREVRDKGTENTDGPRVAVAGTHSAHELEMERMKASFLLSCSRCRI